jgi:hypothetical protein
VSTANAAERTATSPAERLVEPVGGLALLGGNDVAVDVGGDRVGRVPEVLLDDLGVLAFVLLEHVCELVPIWAEWTILVVPEQRHEEGLPLTIRTEPSVRDQQVGRHH